MWRGAYSPAPAARSPLCCCRGSVCLQLFLVIRAQFLFTALKSSCVAKLFKTRCNAPLLSWRVLWWQPVLQEEVLPYRRLFYRRRELPARLCVAGSADLNSALSVIWWCFLSAGQRAASLRENLSLGVRHESDNLSADQMKHIKTLLHILFVAALHTSVLLSRSALPPLWLLKLNEWTSFV